MPKLTIMRDQAGITGREIINVDPRMTPHEILHKAMEVVDPRSLSVHIDGQKVKLPEFSENGECIDRGDEDVMTYPVGVRDMVVICEMKGIDPFTLFVILAISVLTAVYAYSMMPSTPRVDIDSTNNSFYGQRNRARLYSAIPDIYGQFRAYPDLMTSEPFSYYSGFNRMIEQYHVVGVGSYLVEDVRIGSSPIGEAPNYSFEIFEPDANGVTDIGGYPIMHTVKAIGSPELRKVNGGSDEVGTVGGPTIESVDFVYDTIQDRIFLKIYRDENPVCHSFFTTFSNEIIIPFEMDGSVSGSSINGSYKVSELETGVEFELEPAGDAYFPRDFVKFYLTKASESNAFWSPSSPTSGIIDITRLKRFDAELVGPYDTGIAGELINFDLQFLGGVNVYGNPYLEFKADIFRIDKPGGSIIDETDYGAETMKVYGINSGSFRKKFYTFRFNVPFGYYRVSVKRLTTESNAADEQSVCTLEKVAVVNYMTAEDAKFNNLTIVKLKTNNFTANFSPDDNLLNMLVTRKTVTYLSELGIVSTDINPSKNVADAILHMHHKVFQRPTDQLDVDGLYEISDRISRVSPDLMEVSASFDDIDMPLGDRIKLASNTARVTPYIEFGVYRFTRDEKKAPSGLICARDMAKERNYSRVFNPAFPNSKTGVSVEYIDPDSNKKVSVNRVFDNEGNIVEGTTLNMIEINLTLCRNRTQAINRAIFECQKLIDESFVVSDTVLRQGNAYDIGDVVRYADVYLDDVKGGEILTIDRDNMIVFLSEIVPGSSPDYVISYTDRYGRIQGPYNFAAGPTNQSIIMASEDMQSMYSAYLETRQLGSRFVISKVDSSREELFKIVEKRPRENGSVEIKMLQYRDEMFNFEDYLIFGFVTRQVEKNFGLGLNLLPFSVEISAFNSKMLIGLTDKIIYSSDDGNTWQEVSGSIGITAGDKKVEQITSHDGNQIIAALSGARAARSIDGGATWTTLPRYLNSGLTEADDQLPPLKPIGISTLTSNSNDGLTVVAVLSGSNDVGQSISLDGGATWSAMNKPSAMSTGGGFSLMCMDESGSKIFGIGQGLTSGGTPGNIYAISTDRTASWTSYDVDQIFPSPGSLADYAKSVSCSSDMTIIAVLSNNGYLSVSYDSGVTWQVNPVQYLNSGSVSTQTGAASGIKVSSDGKKMFAYFEGGASSYSNDFGKTWGPAPKYFGTEDVGTNLRWVADMSITGDRVLAGVGFGLASIANWEIN